MTVNLVSNVARVLSDFQVETHCWFDSTVSQKLLCFGSEVKVNTDNSSRIGSRRSNSMTKWFGIMCQRRKTLQTWEVAVEV